MIFRWRGSMFIRSVGWWEGKLLISQPWFSWPGQSNNPHLLVLCKFKYQPTLLYSQQLYGRAFSSFVSPIRLHVKPVYWSVSQVARGSRWPEFPLKLNYLQSLVSDFNFSLSSILMDASKLFKREKSNSQFLHSCSCSYRAAVAKWVQ